MVESEIYHRPWDGFPPVEELTSNATHLEDAEGIDSDVQVQSCETTKLVEGNIHLASKRSKRSMKGYLITSEDPGRDNRLLDRVAKFNEKENHVAHSLAAESGTSDESDRLEPNNRTSAATSTPARPDYVQPSGTIKLAEKRKINHSEYTSRATVSKRKRTTSPIHSLSLDSTSDISGTEPSSQVYEPSLGGTGLKHKRPIQAKRTTIPWLEFEKYRDEGILHEDAEAERGYTSTNHEAQPAQKRLQDLVSTVSRISDYQDLPGGSRIEQAIRGLQEQYGERLEIKEMLAAIKLLKNDIDAAIFLTLNSGPVRDAWLLNEVKGF
jgi:hypothetical protein